MGKIFLLFLTIFWKLLVNQVQSDQVVIFDTTLEKKLEWTRYPEETPQANKSGWKEESTFYKEKNVPAYAVCDVDNQNADNWLMLPKIDKGPANRLYIEIHFTMKNCSEFSSSSSTCSDSFSILSHETDNSAESDENVREMFQNEIDRIRVQNDDVNFKNKFDVEIHGAVRSFSVTKPNIFIAIRDSGSCTTILAVKIYYLICPPIILNLAAFNKSITGSSLLDTTTNFGECIEHAEAKEPPYSFCSVNGLWDLTKGCECKLGYAPKNFRSKCEICPDGTFRSKEFEDCVECPPNSVAGGEGADQCPCVEGHSRHHFDFKDMPCFKPSRAPYNVTVKSVNQTVAEISWDLEDVQKQEFVSDKFMRTIVFHVECTDCNGNVIFENITYDSSIIVRELTPASNYTFRIHATNGPSIKPNQRVRDLKDLKNYSNDSQFSEINFTTTPPIISIEKVQITSNEITLEWENPLLNKAIVKFELRYYLISDSFVKEDNLLTSETKATLTGLEENTKYGIQIRCGTYSEWGQYSNIIYANTLKNTSN